MDHLIINQRKVPFEIKRSNRAKRLRLQIESGSPRVVLVAPRFVMKFQIDSFIRRQTPWIDKHWSKVESQLKRRKKPAHPSNYYKDKAKEVIPKRLEFFNRYYKLKYNKVFYRNQKTRWGSCSSKKNLNFNWRLMLAPMDIIDYVIVHELCHLKHMNHSEAFWSLVGEMIPNYKERRKWLKQNNHLLSLD